MELSGAQDALAAAVILRERGQQDRADGHIDADAEGVGAADDLEQAGLGEGFDEAAVLRQHPCVVDANPMQDKAFQRRTEALAEAEAADEGLDALLVRAGGDIDRHQRLGALDGGLLGEVHDVDRGALIVQKVLDRLVHGREDPVVMQRHGSLGGGDRDGVAAGATGQVLFEEGGVAEGRGHQDELRSRQE